jgi:hypothetical protein
MTNDFAVRQLFPTRFPQNIVRGSASSRGKKETNFEQWRIISNAFFKYRSIFFPAVGNTEVILVALYFVI